MKKRNKIIILIVALLGITGVVYARYFSSKVWDFYLSTKGFYFSSDQLNKTNINNLWDGSVVNFNIKNSINSEIISDYDINYTVTCSIVGNENYNCEMFGKGTNTYSSTLISNFKCINPVTKIEEQQYADKASCENAAFNWEEQEVKDELYFEVKSESTPIDNVIVEVKAISNAPYNKTITGYFTLNKANGENELITSYNNYSNYDQLVISNPTSSPICIKVKWDASKLLVEDKTFDIYLANIDGYIEEFDIEIPPNKSTSYVYYKKDFSVNYNISEFTITESTSCAQN